MSVLHNGHTTNMKKVLLLTLHFSYSIMGTSSFTTCLCVLFQMPWNWGNVLCWLSVIFRFSCGLCRTILCNQASWVERCHRNRLLAQPAYSVNTKCLESDQRELDGGMCLRVVHFLSWKFCKLWFTVCQKITEIKSGRPWTVILRNCKYFIICLFIDKACFLISESLTMRWLIIRHAWRDLRSKLKGVK